MSVLTLRWPFSVRAAFVSPRWTAVALVGLAYYLGCLLGFALRYPSSGIAFLWPPTAVLTAAMLLAPARDWGVLLVAALGAHAVAHTQDGVPLGFWLIMFGGNAAQAVIAAAIVRRYARGTRLFTNLHGIVVLIAGVSIVAPALASLIPASVYLSLGWATDFWQAWRARTISNGIASLTLVPTFVLAMSRIRAKPALPSWPRTVELGLLLAGMTAATVLLARTDTAASAVLTLYTPMPFLLWAAARFGPPGVSCAVLCTALLATFAALRGLSPFAGGNPAETIMSVQLFIGINAVPMMLMAGLLAEHRTEHQALVEIERQNSAILRALPDLMFVQTRDGVFLTYYAKDPGQLLVPPESFMGRHMRDVLPADIAEMFSRAFRDATTEEPSVAEYTLVIGGEPRRFEARFIGLADDKILSIVRDMTERERAQRALRESEQRYALATKAGGVGVWDLNLVTGEFYVGPALKAALGYEDHEIADDISDWTRLVHPVDIDHLRTQAQAHRDGTAPAVEAEHRMRHRDGSIRRLITRGEIIERVGGVPVRMIGTYTDITERKRTERALKHANTALVRMSRITALGELTASIAHELKQPLCAIVANANACLRWLDAPTPGADLRGALKDVVEDSHRASAIISHTKELFTTRTVEKQPLQINDVVHDVLELARTRLQRAGIQVHAGLDPRLPLVSADEVQMQQVLLNLVVNSLDAMQDVTGRPRTLHVESRRGLDCVLVSVRDSGKGLVRREMTRIFDPFYSTKREGMGIGLAISRSIVNAHGGALWAVANASGGATFRFTLPTRKEGDA